MPNNQLEISKISVYQTSWYIYILFLLLLFSVIFLLFYFIFVLCGRSKNDKYDNYIFVIFFFLWKQTINS
jgi:hypothetical protein